MKFYKTGSLSEPAELLAVKINRKLLDGRRVLWLVPGGSAIAVAVTTSRLLDKRLLSNLTVTLTDERYGPVGHSGSNAWRLYRAGLQLPGANFLPVLEGKDPVSTTRDFAEHIKKYLVESDYKVGLFGMGADGHIAGIKPGSPAVGASRMVEYFVGQDFERITLTPSAIIQLDSAVLYAVGTEKHSQLDRLKSELPAINQPAQVLKDIADFSVFSDYSGEDTPD